MFYAQKGFKFRSVRPFLGFLEGIGRKGRRTLTKLRFVNTTTGTPFIALRYLKSCENLQKLEIYVKGWIADHRNRVFTKMPVLWAVLFPFETASCILSWRLERDRVRYRQSVSGSRVREEEPGQQSKTASKTAYRTKSRTISKSKTLRLSTEERGG